MATDRSTKRCESTGRRDAFCVDGEGTCARLQSKGLTNSGALTGFLFLGMGAAPSPKVEGGKAVVGGQTVSYDGRSRVLEK